MYDKEAVPVPEHEHDVDGEDDGPDGSHQAVAAARAWFVRQLVPRTGFLVVFVVDFLVVFLVGFDGIRGSL